MSGQKKNWKKRLGIICAVLFALYVLLGFVGLPLLLRYVGLRMVNDGLAGTVTVEAIRVNPFSYSLLLQGIEVKTPDETSVFSASRFYGNFAFWSLFGKGWRFQEVHLAEPSLNVAVDAQGRLNLLQLVKPAAEAAGDSAAPESVEAALLSGETQPFVLPLIRVDRLWVENGGFDLSLALPGGEFRRQGRDINLDLINFSTEPQNANPYAFAAHTAHGESVAVEGQLRLNPLSTSGTVRLSTVQLEDLDLFTADAIGITVDSGNLSLSFGYQFSPVSEPRGLFLDEGHLHVEDVALSGRGEAEPFARLALLDASGFGVDLLEGKARLGALSVGGAQLRIVRDKQGLLNLIRYLFPEERQREIAELVQVDIAAAARQAERDIRLGVVSDNQDIGVALTSAWHQVQQLLAVTLRFHVDAITVENNTLELRDEFPSSPVDFIISDIALKATDVRNYGAEPFPFELGLRTGGAQTDAQGRGTFGATGSFTPEVDKGEFAYKLEGFDLVPFAPYLATVTTAQLVSAKVGSEGSGSVRFPESGLPEVLLEFSGRVDAIAVSDPADGQTVLAVESVALTRAEVKSDPVYFAADTLRIVSPSLRVVRNGQGQINLVQMVPMLAEKFAQQAQGENTQSAQPPAGSKDAAPATDGGKRDAVQAATAAAKQGTAQTAKPAQASAQAGQGASAATHVNADASLSAEDWQTKLVADAIEAARHSQAAEALKATDLENISLKKLEIVGGSVTFIDQAVDPQVAFEIRDAALTVDGIALKPQNITTFKAGARLTNGVEGIVGDVSGELVTLDPLQSAKLTIAVQGITLGSFGGYSEPVVGRPLERGTLTSADLSYSIADSQLKGDSRITMKDVGFAARREGSTGPRLPLDLGIAILSDRNGVMRLDVPVSGDLKDPAFDLSRVIQYALINVLERLVTAPFAVLGSLLGSEAGGEAPATSVVFEPGSFAIPLTQERGLQLLASALYERPTLLLQLRPVTGNAADLQALREQLLSQHLAAYAAQHNVSEARAVERLYEQLLAALAAMDPQARAGIEAMIAQASERAAQAKESSSPVVIQAQPEPLSLMMPPPVVEGDSGSRLQTVNIRSVERARKGSGFITTIDPVQVLVAAVPQTAGESATGAEQPTGAEAVLADAQSADHADAALTQASAAAQPGQRAATEDAATVNNTAASAQAVAPVEPLLEDKRAILLSQTVVTQAAVQELATARMRAISEKLSADAEHPLAAERIRFDEPWEPNPQVPEQTAISGVFFELGAMNSH